MLIKFLPNCFKNSKKILKNIYACLISLALVNIAKIKLKLMLQHRKVFLKKEKAKHKRKKKYHATARNDKRMQYD